MQNSDFKFNSTLRLLQIKFDVSLQSQHAAKRTNSTASIVQNLDEIGRPRLGEITENFRQFSGRYTNHSVSEKLEEKWKEAARFSPKYIARNSALLREARIKLLKAVQNYRELTYCLLSAADALRNVESRLCLWEIYNLKNNLIICWSLKLDSYKLFYNYCLCNFLIIFF